MNEEDRGFTKAVERASREATIGGREWVVFRDSHGRYQCELYARRPLGPHDFIVPPDAKDAEVRCTDHWHCDPALAAHNCAAPDRSRPCPSCGEEVRS